jgi:hypothetical protein
MWSRKSGSRLKHFGSGSANPNVSDIHNRVPVARELADLLGIHLEKNVRTVTRA